MTDGGKYEVLWGFDESCSGHGAMVARGKEKTKMKDRQ